MPSPARGLTQPQRVEKTSRRLVEAAAQLITEKSWEAMVVEVGLRNGIVDGSIRRDVDLTRDLDDARARIIENYAPGRCRARPTPGTPV